MSKTKSHFNTDHLKSDLKGRTVRGATATFIGQGLKFAINLISIMVLARLLTPEDFGLVAMASAFTGFIMIFKDLGLSMATVQQEDLNHAKVSTLFWINLGLSTLLMLLTLALAPGIAWFYGDQRLVAITAAFSIAFLFGGLTVQHQALLRRQMRLTAITVIDVTAMAIGIIVAIATAKLGFGYWALVWMPIATALATAIGVWYVSGWLPGRPVRRSGVRSMLKFGGYLSTFSFVNYFARNADNIVIGRFIGADALGLYSRAYSLLLFPIGQITAPMTAVAVPALSRLQNDQERYRNYYLKAIKVIAYITLPMVTALMALSKEVVSIVLGPQWIDAASIFQILAVVAFFQPITSTVGWIYVSLGHTKRMATWGLIASPIIVLSFFAGVFWGIIGVAIAYAITTTVLIPFQLLFALKNTPISIYDLYKTVALPFLSSIFFGTTLHLGLLLFLDYGVYSRVTFSLMFGCVSLVVFSLIVRPLKADLLESLSAISLLKNNT